MVMCSLIFISLVIIILVYNESRKKEPRKILGVYTRPGKWYILKYCIFICLLVIRRLKYYIYGKEYFYNNEELEKIQPLSSHKLAFDAVFFQAVSQDGFYFCCGLERRQEAKANGLVYIVMPEYGILANEKLPNTRLDADPESLSSSKYYGAEGISLALLEPMKKWKVSYKGKMRKDSSQNIFVNVELNAIWTSNYPWFLFEVDMPAKLLARGMAKEKWSREYFKTLQEAHQSHYEQMGYLNGTLIIDGKEYPLKNLDAFRDHSFGFKRDWSLMHRYIYHLFYLSDGTRISVGVISQPCTSSSLEMGYVVHPNYQLDAIDNVDLKLYHHAEWGNLPDKLCFTFAAGGLEYEAEVSYKHDAVHFKGNAGEAKMRERFLTCVINGVPGRGISEWQYNNPEKDCLL